MKRIGILSTGLCAAALIGGVFGPAAYADQPSLSLTDAATFQPTGAPVQWTVPAGVTSVNFEAAGGGGGHSPGAGSAGGLGADVQGSFPVTPGQVLTISVGENGGTGAGGWGGLGMSGGPANTAKQSDRDGGAGGGATVIQVANADGSDPQTVAVAGGGGGQGGGSSDPASAGNGGAAGCQAIVENDIHYYCGVTTWAGVNGDHGTVGPLGGNGGAGGGSPTPVGERGQGASGLGGNGGSGGGGVNGGAAGSGAKGISAGGGGGSGSSWVSPSVTGSQIANVEYNSIWTMALSGPGVVLSWGS
jgi:Glycine rich protein